MAARMTPHITIITRLYSRITGKPGARVQLCGAEPTDRDILVRDFRRLGANAIKAWNICQACVERAQEAK